MKRSLILLIMMFLSTTIFALNIFINNVKVDSMQMQNLEMKNCTVNFDSAGDIHIKAPGIKLVQEQSEKIKKDYFLIISITPSHKNVLTIFINGSKAFDIDSTVQNFNEKISSFLHSGKNTILIVGKPELTPTNVDFMFGSGKEDKGKLELTPIETKKISYDKNGLSLTLELKAE